MHDFHPGRNYLKIASETVYNTTSSLANVGPPGYPEELGYSSGHLVREKSHSIPMVFLRILTEYESLLSLKAKVEDLRFDGQFCGGLGGEGKYIFDILGIGRNPPDSLSHSYIKYDNSAALCNYHFNVRLDELHSKTGLVDNGAVIKIR